MLNNKLLRAVCVAAGLLMSAAASAQVYVGATVGKSQWRNDCNGTSMCSNTSDTYKVFGGYNINSTFALEGSYYSLGATERSVQNQFGSYYHKLKASAFELSGIAKYDLTNELTGFAKLGVATIKEENAVDNTYLGFGRSAGTFSQNSTQPVLGLGLTYKLSKELSLRGELETRKVKYGSKSVSNLSVGLQYAF
ncbi:outer membrane beta-barrel protein [Undibacterium rugosum]|uniref:Outer membrane beta-barrel protein n=1 Tax=Undibacterium rugosum TaxID=2762291 RepID=A0A923IC34_9BURK|nr:outer membrane beta-barrel protein [Undibacterium rugosum]MBC3936615.1 outer membrane beta-barrel protein [Undibacterium rugosum]MBR7776939.1 outer membrane beta-barrel protein [Undibacterium rugosum]